MSTDENPEDKKPDPARAAAIEKEMKARVEFQKKVQAVAGKMRDHLGSIYDVSLRPGGKTTDEHATICVVELLRIQTDMLSNIDENLSKLTGLLGQLAEAASPLLGALSPPPKTISPESAAKEASK